MSTPAEQLRRATPAISTLPVGLLGFLGLNNGGEYPRDLAGFYQPVIDGFRLLTGVNFEENNPGNGAVPAAGNAGSYSTAQIVPQTEAWFITMLSHRVTTGAGEAWNGYIALRRFPVSSPNVVHALCTIKETSFGASVTGGPQIAQHMPLIAGPGDEICVFSTLVTGAPQIRPHIRFARLTF